MVFDNSLEKRIKKGLSYIESNNITEAQKLFEDIANDKKSELIGYLFLGIIQIKIKNFTVAKSFFNKILIVEPNNQDANLNLGLVFLEEKNYEKAILFFDKVIKNSKNNFNAHYHRGLSYFLIKKYDDAIDSFKVCTDLNKDFYHQTVTSAQIENYLSEKSGKDLTAFFDQYLRTTLIPKLEYEIKGGSITYRYVDII